MSSIEICTVMVFYRRKVDESPSLAVLRELAGLENSGCRLSKIIAYDNSPEFEPTDLIRCGYEYVGDATNGGVASAYNYALQLARAAGCGWLLLLDQDTRLDLAFWTETTKALIQSSTDAQVVAVVPRVRDGGKIVSPSRIHWGDIHRPVKHDYRGACPFEITAIGSGALVNVAFLEQIGGFDKKYWLDCADRKLFAQIWRLGRKVWLSEAVLEHELSIFDYNGRVSEARYQNILSYEWMFQKECKRRGDHCIFLARLLYRSVKLLVIARNKKFARMTLVLFFTVLGSLFRW